MTWFYKMWRENDQLTFGKCHPSEGNREGFQNAEGMNDTILKSCGNFLKVYVWILKQVLHHLVQEK